MHAVGGKPPGARARRLDPLPSLEWMEGWMDGWMDGRMGGWMGGWMGRWTDEWVDGWMAGWMDGRMDGWRSPPPSQMGHRAGSVQSLERVGLGRYRVRGIDPLPPAVAALVQVRMDG